MFGNQQQGVDVNSMTTLGAGPQTGGSKKTEKQFREELDALNKESSALNEQRIRIQTEIERARKEKTEHEAALLAEFGTCDLAKLEEILAEREAKNEEALAQYRAGIKKLREEIEEVSGHLAKIR